MYSPWAALCWRAADVRSPTASRSHCDTDAGTFRTSRPAALRVSICSLTESSAHLPVPKYRSTSLPRSETLRVSRSSFTTKQGICPPRFQQREGAVEAWTRQSLSGHVGTDDGVHDVQVVEFSVCFGLGPLSVEAYALLGH